MLVETPNLNERKSSENILPFLLVDTQRGGCLCVWLTYTCKAGTLVKDFKNIATRDCLSFLFLFFLMLGFVFMIKLILFSIINVLLITLSLSLV